jgi:hypothetical protein
VAKDEGKAARAALKVVGKLQYLHRIVFPQSKKSCFTALSPINLVLRVSILGHPVVDLTFTIWSKFCSEHFDFHLTILPMLHFHLSSGSDTVGPFEPPVARSHPTPITENCIP